MNKNEIKITKVATGKRRRKMAYESGKITGSAGIHWYRGADCNFNPNISNFSEPDAIRDYVLKGWLPDVPFLDKKSSITTFGSCFAIEVAEFLKSRDYNISSPKSHSIVDFMAGVNNTFAIRQLVEWVYEGKVLAEETWHKDDKGTVERNENQRKRTLKKFKHTDLFIITLGLSEVWYNKETGDVFWRAIPENLFDGDLHGFKVSSFSENKENIQAIYDIIIKNNPNAKILLTMSPVPLVATFRPVSCLTANSVSKSILRAAIDEFYRDNNGQTNKSLYYWPSYEIVEKIFPQTIQGGPYQSDNRHIKRNLVEIIMKSFEEYYVIPT